MPVDKIHSYNFSAHHHLQQVNLFIISHHHDDDAEIEEHDELTVMTRGIGASKARKKHTTFKTSRALEKISRHVKKIESRAEEKKTYCVVF